MPFEYKHLDLIYISSQNLFHRHYGAKYVIVSHQPKVELPKNVTKFMTKFVTKNVTDTYVLLTFKQESIVFLQLSGMSHLNFRAFGGTSIIRPTQFPSES